MQPPRPVFLRQDGPQQQTVRELRHALPTAGRMQAKF
jgi:hypothetical protein